MFFDNLCKIVEHHQELRDLKQPLNEAALFVFDKPPHEFLPKSYDEADTRWLMDNFYLPFPVTAIEDPASVVVLIDEEENAHGLGKVSRRFVEALPATNINPSAYREGLRAKTADMSGRVEPGTMVVTLGRITDVETGPGHVNVAGDISGVFLIGPSGPPLILPREWGDPVLSNARAALEEATVLIDPSRFIVQSTPLSVVNKKERPLKKGQERRIPRSTERPTYTVLTPQEIKQKIMVGAPEPEGTHASPVPHRRRRHTRLLQSAFFKHKQGQIIRVRASYIGPTEAVVKNRRYRVITTETTRS